MSNSDIYLDMPIETQARRAARQVEITEMLLAKYFSGFVPSPELLEEAENYGIDVSAVIQKVNELMGVDDDENL